MNSMFNACHRLSAYFNKLLKALSIIDFKNLAFSLKQCPLHGPSVFVRLNESMLGVRCCVCGAAPIATTITTVLQARVPDFKKKTHYEMASRGPFFEFLKKNVEVLTCSEFLDDVGPGDYRDGIQCQDVQSLTYKDSSFDVVTCTEVFEHVPNDAAGFAEVFRVLRPLGIFIFTVPLFSATDTVARAIMENGKVQYLKKPEYHDDSIRGVGKVLVYRDYGFDIQQRLEDVGFKDVEVINVADSGGFGFTREVIVAYK